MLTPSPEQERAKRYNPFFQYIGPTLMFLLAVMFYGEVPGADKMVTFAFIWVALAVFVADALYTQRRMKKGLIK